MTKETDEIKIQVTQWLQDVVIGLRLCPFAKAPFQKQQIRLVVSTALTEEALNEELINECQYLDNNSNTETTLIICTNLLFDFFDFCQYLQWAESTLKQHQWHGIYQIANFHPDYQFSNTDSNDPQNLTNRSPYPIIHLLREVSLSSVLDNFSEPESIPEKNIQTMNNLSEIEKQRYFHYLFNQPN